MRIEKIASLVDKDASVIDIGTDHGYLPIYLYKKNITKYVDASDVSDTILNCAKNNLVKNNLDGKINLIVSDGFKNLKKKYDIAVISGMGTETIKHILNYDKLPNTLIISSHKNIYELRSFMQDLGYKIIDECVILDNNIYYDIIKYRRGIDILDEYELLVGKSENYDYVKYLYNKYNKLYLVSGLHKYKKYMDIIEKRLDCLK